MTDKKTTTKKKTLTYAEMRKIDVTSHIEKKGKFNYLSWSHAIDALLLHDENATWEYLPKESFPDGSMMITCSVTAFDKVRTMQLPVLDFKNKAVSNPSAMDINTAMQRCLAKAIACHGIGLHIYHGEDLPPEYVKELTQAEKDANEFARQTRIYQTAAKTMHKSLDTCASAELLQATWDSLETDLAELKEFTQKGYDYVAAIYHGKLEGFKG